MTNTTSTILKNAPIINMGNVELPQVIYKGQPVLTARAVAEVLGCDLDSIQKNYARNRHRFTEGKHVHVLEASEAKALGFSHVAVKLNGQIVGLDFFRYSGKGMTLFTRDGVALLATTVGTDAAWALRQTFIDAYFTLEGMATGALSVQEGAQMAHKLVSQGAVALPGIQMQPASTVPAVAGRNAPDVLAEPLPKALSLIEQAVLALKQLERAEQAAALGFKAETEWERQCRAAWDENKAAKALNARLLDDAVNLQDALDAMQYERDEAREERDEATRKVAELEAQLSFLRGSCVTRNTLQRALEKVLQEQGLE